MDACRGPCWGNDRYGQKEQSRKGRWLAIWFLRHCYNAISQDGAYSAALGLTCVKRFIMNTYVYDDGTIRDADAAPIFKEQVRFPETAN